MINSSGPTGGKGDTAAKILPRQIQFFDDISAFSKAMSEVGVNANVSTLLSLHSNFLGSSDGHLILNIEHFGAADPSNILVLAEDCALLYSKSPPSTDTLLSFSNLFPKPCGKSTALAFATLRQGVANYRARLESLIASVTGLEQEYSAQSYHQLILDFQRLFDRLENLYEILIDLQETGIREVETRYISFDYKVLLAECSNLVDRCRNRLNMLRDLARDREARAASELNQRLERLNDVVKRLTALTVLLMIPTLIASHFGMNFVHMPELRVVWVYPAVVGAQLVLVVAGFILFKRIGWL